MKRKARTQHPIVPQEILERARHSAAPDTLKRPSKCVVCGDPCAPNSAEGLCWVCRRLKISAWRDVDAQVSAQE